jgi:hypothetical protein
MFNRFKAAAAGLVLACALGLGLSLSQPAYANQSPTASYCQPLGATDNQPIGNGVGLLENASGCVLQPGDTFSDGPLDNPAPIPSPTDNSFAWHIPANTWISQGNRVYTNALSTTAPASTLSYWWLHCNECSGEAPGTWIYTTPYPNPTSPPVAPDAYSTFQYTVYADSHGLWDFTAPNAATQMLPGGDIVYSQGTQPLVGYVLADMFNITGNPVYFYSTYDPTVGFNPVFNFWAQAANCNNTSTGNIVQFANSAGNAILSVPCASSGGNGVKIQGQVSETGGLLRNESTMAASSYALCGGQGLKRKVSARLRPRVARD